MARKSLQDCLCRRKGLFPALAAAALAALCGGTASASGYEFDGIGVRSIARGGAVIADAGDWTAVYWNPANLTAAKAVEAGLELKSCVSHTRDGNSFNTPVGNPFGKTGSDSSFVLGSAGAAIPLDDRSALGFGAYAPLLQGSRFRDTDPAPAFYNSLDHDGCAAIAVGNLSYARKLSDRFSGAVGVNLIYGRLKSSGVHDFAVSPILYQLTQLGYYSGPLNDVVTQELDGDGYGVEGIAGARFDYSDDVSFGAVLRTGAGVRIKGNASAVSASPAVGAERSGFGFTLRQPPTSGIGAAWRAKKNLKLTCDFTQTWWKGFSNAFDYKTPGAFLLTEKGNTFDWKNSCKFRAGALWNLNERTDLMFGYAFDTPAIDKDSLDFSNAVDVPMRRFSAAVSRRWGALEGSLGALTGSGSRTEESVRYKLSGWYLMSEIKYVF